MTEREEMPEGGKAFRKRLCFSRGKTRAVEGMREREGDQDLGSAYRHLSIQCVSTRVFFEVFRQTSARTTVGFTHNYSSFRIISHL